MTVVAQESGIRVRGAYAVGYEVEAVRSVLPVGNEPRDVFVDGHEGVLVDPVPHEREIPPTLEVGVSEIREIQRPGRRHNEEVPYARAVIHVPVRRAGEQQPVIPACPGVVVLAGRAGVKQPHGTVRVDLEDGHISAHARPVVDADPVTPLQDRIDPPVQPDPGLGHGLLMPECRETRQVPRLGPAGERREYGDNSCDPHMLLLEHASSTSGIGRTRASTGSGNCGDNRAVRAVDRPKKWTVTGQGLDTLACFVLGLPRPARTP